ncbi:hypothetical protein [Microbacterium sp. BLY]|uniref:hypothetical protein n=1 Tax=Microbacterium sp. BLY TaxID=2823280 RepID=UPI001B33CD89|nr:hypothetical protein [Microbacterium sp. BLY]MBP3977004.1 hypothetical protein [Microbacterium sp. BLY]
MTTPTPIIERHHVSWETYNFMRQELARLEAEKAQLEKDVAYWGWQTNYWYMKANYTDRELQAMYLRRSRAAGELTAEWTATHESSAA